MWMPTHVQVTVQRASGLLIKGKHGTNDCFVTIALGKTKYQTSVKQKAEANVEWHEECELPIPEHGNTAEIVLTALHRNFLGVDEFLGRAVITLNSLDQYEHPKNRWYTLQSKPGKENKAKERGRLEVKVALTVKAGSLTDLSRKEKHKSSIGQLSHVAQNVGGSLLSIGSLDKRKGIKKFAKSIGSKMHLRSKKKDDFDDNSSIGSISSLRRPQFSDKPIRSRQTLEDADPGVVSDEDDFMFDDLSHKSSGSSLNQVSKHTEFDQHVDDMLKKPNIGSPNKLYRMEDNKSTDEWELKLKGNKNKSTDPSMQRRSWESPKLSSRIEEEDDIHSGEPTPKIIEDVRIQKTPDIIIKAEKESMFSKLKNLRKEHKHEDQTRYESKLNERLVIGGENEQSSPTINRISNELAQKFQGKTREDLILMTCELQSDLDHSKKKLKDLEDYLDELLLRVMETTPRILQNPYVSCKLAHKQVM